MKNRIAAFGVAAAVATTGGFAFAGGSALAADDDSNQGQQAPSVSAKASAKTTTPGLLKCDGGRNINMRSRIVDVPFVFSETAINAQDQAVPGAQLVVNGPSEGHDTLLVTFSAETQLRGGTNNDWMGLEVHRNGIPIEPFTAVNDVLALTGSPSYNGNSLQFCTKVGKGTHVLRTHANLQDNSGTNLSGWLDDYTVSVVRYD